MADLKTTAEERAKIRRYGLGAYYSLPSSCTERLLDDLDTLLTENAKLRAALRTVIHEHDGTHSDDCEAHGETTGDEDICACVDHCGGRHCDCGATNSRNDARAALGEP